LSQVEAMSAPSLCLPLYSLLSRQTKKCKEEWKCLHHTRHPVLLPSSESWV
jgi:hypothetical protein